MDKPSPTTVIASDTIRARKVERITLLAMGINAALALGQLIIGLMANAFSLVADAAHTLSDLVTDTMVLFAGKRGSAPADRNHPYGHGRIETMTSLVLAASLIIVGGGFLWSAGERLQSGVAAHIQPIALVMALITLLAKESLFRYTLTSARQLKSTLLEANAWHARSDAASSLVVAIGIAGTLLGIPFFEPLGAAIVGFMIISMGGRIGWQAAEELIDTGLNDDALTQLQHAALDCDGVRGLHQLRTRKMAGRILCDVHLDVAPDISVSEGHFIAETVRKKILATHSAIREVLVHIDPDEEMLQHTSATPSDIALPSRTILDNWISDLLHDQAVMPCHYQVHYLNNTVSLELFFNETDGQKLDIPRLLHACEALYLRHPVLKAVHLFTHHALKQCNDNCHPSSSARKRPPIQEL